MAANTGTIHGGDILLYYDVEGTYTPFANATSHTVTHGSMSPREIANKSQGLFPSIKPGKHGIANIQMQGARSYDGVDYYAIKALMQANTRIKVKLSGRPVTDTSVVEVNEEIGDKYEEGYGYFTELSQDNPHDAGSTFSATIVIDGKLDTATVAE